jgi:hypothetical protein
MTPEASVLDVPEELFRKQVYDIICRELGPAGYARFLMTFCSGKGDYTAERHQWLDTLTIDEVLADMAKLSNQQA